MANGHVARNGTNADDVMLTIHIQSVPPLAGNRDRSALTSWTNTSLCWIIAHLS